MDSSQAVSRPVLGELDRVTPTRRPNRNPVGYQRWYDLGFVHWRVSADQVATLLPNGLEVDTFDGSAWIGLVPFRMAGVRPRWFPAVPGVSACNETNVRTYVHYRGVPGVWFFSLDAANRCAVFVARWRWRLNYHHATMRVERCGGESGEGMVYWSARTDNSAGGSGVSGPGVLDRASTWTSGSTVQILLPDLMSLGTRCRDHSNIS